MADYSEDDDKVLLDLGDLGSNHKATIRAYKGGAPKLAIVVVGKKNTYPAKRLPLDVAVALAVALEKHGKKIAKIAEAAVLTEDAEA